MQECRFELAPSRHTDECGFARRLWPRRVDPRRLARIGLRFAGACADADFGHPDLGRDTHTHGLHRRRGGERGSVSDFGGAASDNPSNRQSYNLTSVEMLLRHL